jgi:hypothetical protein
MALISVVITVAIMKILECAAMYLSTFNMEARGFFTIQEPTDQTHTAFIPNDSNLQPKY